MKRLLTVLILLLAFSQARGLDNTLRGPLGRLNTTVSLPAGFNAKTDSCRLIILCHGFWANQYFAPIPHLAQFFLNKGYAVLRFDFGGCGFSEGASTAMTVETQIADARAVYEYARSLPYVTSVSLMGHSQGGLVAGILSGRLEAEGRAPDSLFLLAPAAVIRDYAIQGRFFGITCDPVNLPESVNIYGYRIGREYIRVAQGLQVYEETSAYKGPAFIIQGTADNVVPIEYGQRYHDAMPGSTFYPIPGESHFFLFTYNLDRILNKCLGN
ncbi:MAG: alpha/beta fold hydrolase [Bacteroidales bacterium]|nr:alpha/beta fold hydrolase [Bacteroidales bacterium]